MSLSIKARLREIEARMSREHDFLTIRVRGVLGGFIGTDPLDPGSNISPEPGESYEGFVARMQAGAIAAGKSQVVIFGQSREGAVL
jgi:hypothetical protein